MKEEHSNCEDQKRNRWWSPRTTQKGNFFAAARARQLRRNFHSQQMIRGKKSLLISLEPADKEIKKFTRNLGKQEEWTEDGRRRVSTWTKEKWTWPKIATQEAA